MSNPLDLPGIMLSILAYDPRDRSLGIVLASSGVAIGARCPHLAVGRAAVSSQGFTNLKVGPLALDLIQCGLTAQEVLQALRQHDRWMDFRQIAVVSAEGEVEVHTGGMNTGWAGHVIGEGVACLGNGLPDGEVLEAMHADFAANAQLSLAERLLSAIEKARSVIGMGPALVSSSLMVRSPSDTGQIDLRVDVAREPPGAGGCSIADLRRLFEQYRPLIEVYEQRSRTPHPV